MLLKDEGHGITVESLAFWRENRNRIGRILSVEASEEPLGLFQDEHGTLEYNVDVVGTDGNILLSGCNCGYGGEGPNGTATILIELGIGPYHARHLMTRKQFKVDVS